MIQFKKILLLTFIASLFTTTACDENDNSNDNSSNDKQHNDICLIDATSCNNNHTALLICQKGIQREKKICPDKQKCVELTDTTAECRQNDTPTDNLCTENYVRCSDDKLAILSCSKGKAKSIKNCPNNQTCHENDNTPACVNIEENDNCKENKEYCDTQNTHMKCEIGKKPIKIEDCGIDQFCHDDQVTVTCLDKDKNCSNTGEYCKDNKHVECKNIGDKPALIEDCGNSSVCHENQGTITCEAKENKPCLKDKDYCINNKHVRCEEKQETVVEDCNNGGFCLTPEDIEDDWCVFPQHCHAYACTNSIIEKKCDDEIELTDECYLDGMLCTLNADLNNIVCGSNVDPLLTACANSTSQTTGCIDHFFIKCQNTQVLKIKRCDNGCHPITTDKTKEFQCHE